MIWITIPKEIQMKSIEFARRKEPTTHYYTWENKEEKRHHIFIGKIGEWVGVYTLEKVYKIPTEKDFVEMFKVVDEESYSDRGDCIIFPGTNLKVVDFKSTEIEKIIVDVNQLKLETDIIVAVKLRRISHEQWQGKVYGWLTIDEFKKRHTPKKFKYGLSYHANLHEFRDISELEYDLDRIFG